MLKWINCIFQTVWHSIRTQMVLKFAIIFINSSFTEKPHCSMLLGKVEIRQKNFLSSNQADLMSSLCSVTYLTSLNSFSYLRAVIPTWVVIMRMKSEICVGPVSSGCLVNVASFLAEKNFSLPSLKCASQPLPLKETPVGGRTISNPLWDYYS